MMMSTMEFESLRTDAPPSVKRCLWSLRRWALSLASLLVASCGHIDIPHGAGDPVCYGEKLLGSGCLTKADTASLTESRDVSEPVSIITSMVGGNNCTVIREQANGLGPSLCILAYRTITVGAKLRASGPNPLVLIAAESISISAGASVDVSSGDQGAGAGARAARDCSSEDTDGPPGQPDSPFPDGGGGGAGGSLGTLGGAGGKSGAGGMVGHGAGGQPAPAMAPDVLVGGCAGGRGGDAFPTTANGGAAGGFGGGAVYLLAGASITISGQINASGAGGIGGISAEPRCGGGGGGGSGGMIGLEALGITVTGVVYANGGGGGGGGGCAGSGQTPGEQGWTSTGPSSAGMGGARGNDDGGTGGSGSTGASPGIPGEAPKAFTDPGGGGGGGGGGVIRVFGTVQGSLDGKISPPL